jgi:hypothetical protein
MAKNNNKNKTTKHTIEFSNNTPTGRATRPAALGRSLAVRTTKDTTEVELPSWTSPRSTD